MLLSLNASKVELGVLHSFLFGIILDQLEYVIYVKGGRDVCQRRAKYWFFVREIGYGELIDRAARLFREIAPAQAAHSSETSPVCAFI